MSYNSIDSAKKFCSYLEQLRCEENYSKILMAFNQPTCFRALWANVAEAKTLFRCRRHIGKPSKLRFKHSSEIGYNRDEESIKIFGRCNTPYQAFLYLSENQYTAILETLQECNKDDLCDVTIGVWETQKTIDVLYVVQPNKEKRLHTYEQILGERYDNHVANMKFSYPDYEDFSRIYFDYLDERFKSDEKGLAYQITAAYSNLCIKAIDSESKIKSYGIIYASVTQSDFFNVAFAKEVEEKKMIVLKDAFKLTLIVKKENPKSFDDLKIIYIEKSKCVLENGEIEW